MNRIVFAAVAAVLLVCLCSPALTLAGNDGPSASGNFQFSFEDGQPRFLEITGNRAVMSGVISESNILSAVGLRILLVVEDNGEGVNAANDKLTWGIYQPPASGWVPQDAERDDDNGAGLKWIATDFERPDEPGVPSDQSKIIGCQSFSLASYDFTAVKHGGGNIQVQP
jgi:hypothetical protein